MLDLGVVKPGSTIRIPWSSFDKDDGSAITMTNYAAADILIYKDGSTTERASTAGFTATTDFDSKTGKHLSIIDLADNTTADFFAAGSEYLVAIDAVTVDGVTTGGWIARFYIGHREAIFDTTIATLSSQTSFTLTAGSADDNAYNGCLAYIHDAASAVQCCIGIISAYTGSTKTVTLIADPGIFTVAAKDNISILPPRLMPTTRGRTLDVSAGGEAGVDWANVGSPTTTLDLSGTTIKTTQKVDVDTIKTNPVVNGGTITFPTNATVASTTNITAGTITTATNVTTVNGLAAGVITATSIAADAITDAKVAADVTIASVTGAVGSVTGAVGSVTGNVGGNVTGSIGSLAAQAKLDVNAEADTALSDVGLTTTITGRIDAAVTTRATPAQVNSEVVDALAVDTYAEPGQGTPAATTTLAAKINYLFKAWRNKKDQTATLFQLYADDATTVDQKAVTSDDATTTTVGEMATGP